MVTLDIVKKEDIKFVSGMIKDYYDEIAWESTLEKIKRLATNIVEKQDYGRIFTICDTNTAVGYLVLINSYSISYGKVLVIDEIFIKKIYRDQGYGKSCLELVEKIANEENFDVIQLERWDNSSKLINFYSSFGFKQNESCVMTKFLN